MGRWQEGYSIEAQLLKGRAILRIKELIDQKPTLELRGIALCVADTKKWTAAAAKAVLADPGYEIECGCVLVDLNGQVKSSIVAKGIRPNGRLEKVGLD